MHKNNQAKSYKSYSKNQKLIEAQIECVMNMIVYQYNIHLLKIILYVLTWNGLVTTYHSKYVKELNLSPSIEAYIQSRVIKKTPESISLDYRRGDEEGGRGIDDVARLFSSRVEGLICSE